jgi:hypothetical protein
VIRIFILAATVAGLAVTGPARAFSPLLEQAVDLPGYAMWSDSGAPGLGRVDGIADMRSLGILSQTNA